MAIVIKVKADTKELEKDIQAAAQNAKKTIDKATASAGTGATGINKISEEFKRQRTEAEALSKRLEDVKKGSEGLGSSFANVSKSAAIAATAITAVAAAAVAAGTALVKMGLDGSEAANKLIETAFAAGKTVEQMQKLEKGGKDLTAELRAVGGVLQYETIKQASAATHQFAIFARQVDALKIKLAVDLTGAFDSAGRAMQESLLRAEPTIRESTRRMSAAFEAMIPVLSRVGELSLRLFTFQMENVARVIRAFQTPTVPVSTIDTRHATTLPRFAATGELRDFLRSPQALERAQALRGTGGGGGGGGRAVAARAQENVEITAEMMERIGRTMRQGLTRILDDFEKQLEDAARDQQLRNQRFAREAIQGPLDRDIEARLISGRETRAGLTAQFERRESQRATRVALTADFDAREADRLNQLREQSARLFDEVRNQAIRFKEGIVFTFESAFREGFEKGPKAFLQATASAIKSFFSQIAAELSTGIIELILFGKGGITGRGVGTSGTLGGLGAALGGFGRTGGGGGGGGFLGGLLGNFGGLGGGTFGGSIFGGGAATSISVAPSLSGAVGGFGGFSGGFGSVSNAVAQQLGFGGAGGGSAAGGLLGAIAGPALLGGLLGTGLGGKSLGGKILGGIGGGIAGAGVGLGAAIGFGGGGLLAGALAATGIGLLAAPFLIGAVLLGKAKQRKADEQAADAIWVAEREQIRTLISAVNADRIEGYDALAQWSGIRSNTIAQLNQIKTESVRTSRLTNQLRDLDNGVVAELRAAVERQARRRGVQGLLVPEFESGGRVPGVDRGYDSVMIKARPGEVVLNRQQQASIQARAGDRIFEEVGIQSFYNGGRVSAAPQVPQSLHLTISLEGDAQAVIGNLIVRGVETSTGQRAIVSVVKNGRKNGEL